jgi:hypothetical protein
MGGVAETRKAPSYEWAFQLPYNRGYLRFSLENVIHSKGRFSRLIFVISVTNLREFVFMLIPSFIPNVN